MSAYIAFIHPPENGSEWGATFPDAPGCVSGGDSFEDAVDAAREALSGHLAALASDGEPVPAARTWAEIRVDPASAEDLGGAIVQLVAPRRALGERVRVDIMIDKGLLKLADEAAQARGLTRSAFIEAALTDAAGG